MYKIEIWRFHIIHETYTSNNIKDILKWYRNNWQISYEWGNCSFEVYKIDDRAVRPDEFLEHSFDELEEIGFFKSFEDLDEEE